MRSGKPDVVLFLCMFMAASFLGAVPAALGKTLEFTAIPEAGLAKLTLDVQKLPVSGTVMQIGAHPDDEDNALLALLSKGLHLNTYYLVATWGEGGQNEIGPELYDALGVLRSQELASARAIDGATQLYLGAYDFGFSKTGAEALAVWGHDEQLRRLVRFLRTYRPEIVLTHHDTVTGHGHHQAVGILIQEAFDAAADPTRFPEQITKEGLRPWQVKKLYVSESKNPTVQVNEGEFNPVLGRSYVEIGAFARSMHKCQGMGGAAGAKGDSFRGFKLVKSTLGKMPAREDSITDGLDFSLNQFLEDISAAPAQLTAINHKIVELNNAISSILEAFDPLAPAAIAGDVLKGLGLVRELKDMVAASSLTPADKDLIGQRLQAKENDFLQVLRDLTSTTLDVRADDNDVVPGQTLTVTVTFWNRGPLLVDNVRLSLDVPGGWVTAAEGPGGSGGTAAVGYNSKAEAKFKVTVSPGASFTGAFDPAPVKAKATWQLMGTQLWTDTDAEVKALPAVAVSLDPGKLMVPAANSTTTRTISVRLRNNVRGAVKGQVRLTVPEGWAASAVGEPGYAMKAEGEETVVPFNVSIPAGTQPGSYDVKASATYDGGSSSTSVQTISYPHINTRYLLKPAVGTVGVIDVKVAPDLKVGYVSSGFDNVPAALRQMGVDVTLLGPADLASGDLSRFDTIVVGIRAYLSRPDLGANNARLLDYVRNGGNLIVQYHKTGEMRPEQAPFPITISSNRVTVEGAPVTVLQPEHVLFNAPNKLGPEDWDGWIQERGLYFPSQWAGDYTPLVAMNDPGEPVQKGSWLVASYGKGTYIYTALVWYRQLDGLVPGGYRAFANMISLPKTK